MNDFRHEPWAMDGRGGIRNRPLLFSQYPSADELVEMRAMLADENQARALWQAQLGLDAATVRVVFDAMHRDWTSLWRRFGFRVDCLSAVPVGPCGSIPALLETNGELAEAVHAFEEKWGRYIPARLTRTA